MDTAGVKRRRKRLEAAGATPARRATGPGDNAPQDLLASFCTLDTRVLTRRSVGGTGTPVSGARERDGAASVAHDRNNHQRPVRPLSSLSSAVNNPRQHFTSLQRHHRSSLQCCDLRMADFRNRAETLCEIRQMEARRYAMADCSSKWALCRQSSSPVTRNAPTHYDDDDDEGDADEGDDEDDAAVDEGDMNGNYSVGREAATRGRGRDEATETEDAEDKDDDEGSIFIPSLGNIKGNSEFTIPGIQSRLRSEDETKSSSCCLLPALPGIQPRRTTTDEIFAPPPLPGVQARATLPAGRNVCSEALPGIQARSSYSSPTQSCAAAGDQGRLTTPVASRDHELQLPVAAAARVAAAPPHIEAASPACWTDARTGAICKPVYLPGPVYGEQTVEQAIDLLGRTASSANKGSRSRRKSMPSCLAIDGVHRREQRPSKGVVCTPSYRGSKTRNKAFHGGVSPGIIGNRRMTYYHSRCCSGSLSVDSPQCPGSTPGGGGPARLKWLNSSSSSSWMVEFTQSSSPISDRSELPAITEGIPFVDEADVVFHTARETAEGEQSEPGADFLNRSAGSVGGCCAYERRTVTPAAAFGGEQSGILFLDVSAAAAAAAVVGDEGEDGYYRDVSRSNSSCSSLSPLSAQSRTSRAAAAAQPSTDDRQTFAPVISLSSELSLDQLAELRTQDSAAASNSTEATPLGTGRSELVFYTPREEEAEACESSLETLGHNMKKEGGATGRKLKCQFLSTTPQQLDASAAPFTPTPTDQTMTAERCLRFNSLQWKKIQEEIQPGVTKEQLEKEDDNLQLSRRSVRSMRSLRSVRSVRSTTRIRSKRVDLRSRKRWEILRQLREQPLVTAALRTCFLLTVDPELLSQPTSAESKTVVFGSIVVATTGSPEVSDEKLECVEVKPLKPMRDVTFAVPGDEKERAFVQQPLDNIPDAFWTSALLDKVKSNLNVAIPSTLDLQRALQSMADEIVLTEHDEAKSDDENSVKRAENCLNRIAAVLQERRSASAATAGKKSLSNMILNDETADTHSSDLLRLSRTIQSIRTDCIRVALMEIERLTHVFWSPMQMISMCSLIFTDLPPLESSPSSQCGADGGSGDEVDNENVGCCYHDDDGGGYGENLSPMSRGSSPIDLMMAAASESPCSCTGLEQEIIKQSMLHTVDGVFVYRIENFSEFYVMGPALGSGGEGTVALCLPRQVAELLDLDAGLLDIDALREQRWRELQPKLKRPAERRTFNGLGWDVEDSSDEEDEEADGGDDGSSPNNDATTEARRNQAISNALRQRPELRQFAFAVKITPKEKWRSRDLFRMAHVLGSLRHPNVLRHRAFYEDKWNYYFVMDLAEGPELLDYLSSAENVSQEQCRELMRQVLSALAYLHSEGIVHRDVKPENFVCRQAVALGKPREEGEAMEDEEDGTAPAWSKKKSVTFHKETEELGSVPNLLLLDFGLACYKDETAQTEPNGTDSYMAPELLAARRPPYNYGSKVDLWGAGIILCLMLTGTSPFGDTGPRDYGLATAGERQESLDSFEAALRELRQGEASGAPLDAGPEVGKEEKSPAATNPDGTDPRLTAGREWAHVSTEAKDLVQRLLIVNPEQRLSAEAALKHPWFDDDDDADATSDESEDDGCSSCVSGCSSFCPHPDPRDAPLKEGVQRKDTRAANPACLTGVYTAASVGDSPSRGEPDGSMRRKKVHMLPELIRYKWLALHEARQQKRRDEHHHHQHHHLARTAAATTPTLKSSQLLTPRGVLTPLVFSHRTLGSHQGSHAAAVQRANSLNTLD